MVGHGFAGVSARFVRCGLLIFLLDKQISKFCKKKRAADKATLLTYLLAGPVLPSVEIIPDRSLWRTRDLACS